MKKIFFLVIPLITVVLFPQQRDTVKSYKLEEITVKSGIIIEPKSVTKINADLLEKSDAVSLSEVGRLIPSLKVQTNSRGETLYFIRGSGERQIGLFFDGVQLNLPWDNRIDLSLIPTQAIEEINVTKGVASVLYGANALAGIVNVFPKKYSGVSEGRISFNLGSGNFQKYSGFLLNGNDKFSYLISLNYNKKEGYRLPTSYKEGFPESGNLRNNSYSNSANGYIKLDYKPTLFTDLSASFSFITAEKGVPPEMNVSSPRYWKYPEWNKYTLNINGKSIFGDNRNTILSYLVSATKFNSQINQYNDVTYTSLDDIEKNSDDILSGKILLTRLFGKSHIVNISFSAMTTLHEEKFLETNFEEITKYTQNIFSGGIEYEYTKENITAVLGFGLDGNSTPQTGDKPAKESILDYSINSSLVYSVFSPLSLRFNYGRKTRFPTLRESFSGALGKFITNPDLRAEVVNTFETGISFYKNNISAEANIFLTFLKDGIVRDVVTSPEGVKKYKRINKDAVRSYGVELHAELSLSDKINSQVNFTWLNSSAKNSEGEFKDTLEYKPAFLGAINIDYKLYENINSVLEIYYTGNEFAFQGGNEYFQKLPEYILFNLRFSYNYKINNSLFADIFIRINNIFDKLYYSQWGLPEAGREVVGGLSINF